MSSIILALIFLYFNLQMDTKFVNYESDYENNLTRKALFLSLLLPGLGHSYLGSKQTATKFYALEGGIWLTYLGFRCYSTILRDDAILYAHANASASVKGDEDYYAAIEWYPDLQSYNIHVIEEARFNFPTNRDSQLAYIEEHAIPDSLAWNWQDNNAWRMYKKLRKDARIALQNASYCIGAAIFNRIMSGIAAARATKGLQGVNLWMKPKPKGLSLFLTIHF
ncbi:MAG TPA: hypothetical protein EYP60_05555 [bacterium (Candidatus Stahlbacteria)]|nr:hypothetical protein [Candidatus Stahlbacteria bacterium]